MKICKSVKTYVFKYLQSDAEKIMNLSLNKDRKQKSRVIKPVQSALIQNSKDTQPSISWYFLYFFYNYNPVRVLATAG